MTTEYAPPNLYDWTDNDSDPRTGTNINEYRNPNSGQAWTTLANAQANSLADSDVPPTGFEVAQESEGFNFLLGYSETITNFWQMSRAYDIYDNIDDRLWVNLHYNRFEPSIFRAGIEDADSSLVCGEFEFLGTEVGDPRFWWSGRNELEGSASGGRVGAFRLAEEIGDLVGEERSVNNCTNYPSGPSGFPIAAYYSDVIIQVRRTGGAPPNPCDGEEQVPGNPSFCILPDGSVECDVDWSRSEITDGYKTTQDLRADVNGDIIERQAGSIRPVGHADDTAEFWDADYAAAVAAGTATAGKTLNLDGDGDPATTYPVLTDVAYTRECPDPAPEFPETIDFASLVEDAGVPLRDGQTISQYLNSASESYSLRRGTVDLALNGNMRILNAILEGLIDADDFSEHSFLDLTLDLNGYSLLNVADSTQGLQKRS